MGKIFPFQQRKKKGDIIATVGGFRLQIICRQAMLLLQVLIEKLRLTGILEETSLPKLAAIFSRNVSVVCPTPPTITYFSASRFFMISAKTSPLGHILIIQGHIPIGIKQQ